MTAPVDVLAVMFADQFDAIPKREAFADGKHLAALNAKSEEARAAVAELIRRADSVRDHFTPDRLREDGEGRALILAMCTALARVGGGK